MKEPGGLSIDSLLTRTETYYKKEGIKQVEMHQDGVSTNAFQSDEER
jgi:hypothetical protein